MRDFSKRPPIIPQRLIFFTTAPSKGNLRSSARARALQQQKNAGKRSLVPEGCAKRHVLPASARPSSVTAAIKFRSADEASACFASKRPMRHFSPAGAAGRI
jgi:hypothetical protein